MVCKDCGNVLSLGGYGFSQSECKHCEAIKKKEIERQLDLFKQAEKRSKMRSKKN